jgi:hypothetical protein
MIARFNLKQTLLAFLCLIGGIVSYGLAYLFFRYLPAFVAGNFGHPFSSTTANIVAGVALLLVTVSGYRVWLKRGGFYGYHESALYHDLGEDSAGAVVVDYYARRITGPAYVLGQIFLAGPLLMFRAVTLLASRVPLSSALEEKLKFVLMNLRSINKWQSLEEYPLVRQEILYLARMGQIDFSAHKGTPRIKAHLPDGV